MQVFDRKETYRFSRKNIEIAFYLHSVTQNQKKRGDTHPVADSSQKNFGSVNQL